MIFDKPALRALFDAAAVALPLRACSEHSGSVIDRVGREIFVVDPNGEMSDVQVAETVALLAGAINQAGGV